MVRSIFSCRLCVVYSLLLISNIRTRGFHNKPLLKLNAHALGVVDTMQFLLNSSLKLGQGNLITCDALKKYALGTDAECYFQNGICDLISATDGGAKGGHCGYCRIFVYVAEPE